MKCWEVQRKISSLLDEELLQEEKEEVVRHLAECSLCGREYEKLSLIRNLSREIGKVTPERHKEVFSWERVKKVLRFRRILWAFLAIFLVSFTLFVLLGWRRSLEEERILNIERFTVLTQGISEKGERAKVQAVEISFDE
ncbi:MAG: zf-HC2 domain-containing protein [Candidatus Caldatribacteriaceae bacterium]